MTTALVQSEFGLQVRSGSALAAIADRELPLEPVEIEFSCAWCVQEGDTAFRAPVEKHPIAVSEKREPARQVVSHGICPACAEVMRADYRATMREGRVRA